mmetsp:Transcript_2985/g.4827  ORF Transcript_2985/g.4827 Transcript_2985/m.4827 type:complete len:109 (+) Transcript_2985:593-919(+)
MLDANMDTLAEVATTNPLVNFDANGALSDVPNAASLALVPFVGHTLVDGTIDLNINIVTEFVGAEVGGEGNKTVVAETPGEGVPRLGAETVSARHFSNLLELSGQKGN